MVRIFPPFVMTMKQRWENDTKVGIFPPLSFIMTCNDCNLGQNPDLVPEKSINILPAAPLLSCSLSVKEERSEEEALSLTSNILLTKVEGR